MRDLSMSETPLIAATDYPDEALEIIGATPGDF